MNLGNARLAGLEVSLGMDTLSYDYNIVLTVFYISYIIFEIPCNIACKAIGPGWFIPATSLLFGVMTVACAFVQNKAQICGVRFLLGLFEAGMLPGIAYYMSRWYRRSELAFRLSMYIVMAPLAGAFGGLFASGILTLDRFGSLTDWRMIFGIEGIITIGLSLIAFITLTDRPETARWLSAEEKTLAITRIASERTDGQVLDKLDKKKVVSGILNPVTLTVSLIFLFDNITVQGLAFFLPTIVRGIYPSLTRVQQQLRTVPPYAVGAVATLTIPYISSKIDRRTRFFILCAPLMMIGYIMFLATDTAQGLVRYGATFLITTGAFSFGALTNAQVSANVVTDTARSSAIGMNVMCGNIGGLISTWSFLSNDAPDFPTGNGLNLATSAMILILSTGLFVWMRRDNGKRAENQARGEEELAGMGRKEVEDLDWRHPKFRWRE